MHTGSTHAQIAKQLLRGVVKFALRNSLRMREIAELLKNVLVECAIEELRREESAITAARISVMTGVHRKDVDRIINQEESTIPSEGSLIARVIGQWRSHSDFTNKIGEPRVLSNKGSQDQFSQLIRSVSSELNPSLVLAELERVGAVIPHRLGLKLVAHAYVPDRDQLRHYQLLADDSRDLAECVDENISKPPAEKNLHIKTEYDGVPDSLISEVSHWLLKQGTAMHEKFAAYMSSKDKDLNPDLKKLPGRNRITITSFSLTSCDRPR